MLPALLLGYDLLGIASVADACMRRLDHLNINIYVPSTHSNYAESSMEGGQNYSYQIGHNIFRVADMVTEWNSIRPAIADDQALNIPTVKSGSLFSSLITPDRQPWFLFESFPHT